MTRISSFAAAIAVTAASFLMAHPAAAQTKPPAAASSPAPDVKAFDQQTAEFQAKAKLMQEQMDRIRQTQDPQQRQKLLEEHWATMQSAMSVMHGMWGRGMMGGPGMRGGRGMGGPGMMGWGGMRGYYSSLTPEQQKQRQYMMDQYTGMQQTMMDQMLQRQQWLNQPPASPASK